MVADRPLTRENWPLTCVFLAGGVMAGTPDAVLSFPADTGKQRQATADCAEYVPKERIEGA